MKRFLFGVGVGLVLGIGGYALWQWHERGPFFAVMASTEPDGMQEREVLAAAPTRPLCERSMAQSLKSQLQSCPTCQITHQSCERSIDQELSRALDLLPIGKPYAVGANLRAIYQGPVDQASARCQSDVKNAHAALAAYATIEELSGPIHCILPDGRRYYP